MLQFLAQTTTTYNLSTEETTGLAALLGAYFFFVAIIVVIQIIAMWRIFEKMGEAGWKAIIPIYNYWVLCEAVGKPGWWALTFLLGLVPILNLILWIVPLVLSIIVLLELGKGFGKDAVWSIFLLVVFSIIGMLILGFGSDKFDKKRLSAPKAAA